MRNSDGQCKCQNIESSDLLKTTKPLLPSQIEFLESVTLHGALDLSKSLRMIHDLALYHSDISFNDDEKTALYNLKILWEAFERISEET